MAFGKYQKLKLQYSYNGGFWADVEPLQFKKGELIEENSPDCGYANLIYRWVNADKSDYICFNQSKYYKQIQQVSYDDGLNWYETGETQTGSLIEANSYDCDYGVTWEKVNDIYYCEQDISIDEKYYYTAVATEDITFTITSKFYYYYKLDDIVWQANVKYYFNPLTGKKIENNYGSFSLDKGDYMLIVLDETEPLIKTNYSFNYNYPPIFTKYPEIVVIRETEELSSLYKEVVNFRGGQVIEHNVVINKDAYIVPQLYSFELNQGQKQKTYIKPIEYINADNGSLTLVDLDYKNNGNLYLKNCSNCNIEKTTTSELPIKIYTDTDIYNKLSDYNIACYVQANNTDISRVNGAYWYGIINNSQLNDLLLKYKDFSDDQLGYHIYVNGDTVLDGSILDGFKLLPELHVINPKNIKISNINRNGSLSLSINPFLYDIVDIYQTDILNIDIRDCKNPLDADFENKKLNFLTLGIQDDPYHIERNFAYDYNVINVRIWNCEFDFYFHFSSTNTMSSRKKANVIYGNSTLYGGILQDIGYLDPEPEFHIYGLEFAKYLELDNCTLFKKYYEEEDFKLIEHDYTKVRLYSKFYSPIEEIKITNTSFEGLKLVYPTSWNLPNLKTITLVNCDAYTQELFTNMVNSIKNKSPLQTINLYIE